MWQRMAVVGVCWLAASGSALAPMGRADEPKKDRQPSARALNQEVTALLTLYYLKLTPAQAKALRPIAKETAAKAKAAPDLKVSADLRKALTDLRQALIDDDNEDRIDQLEEALDDLRQAEKVEDDVDITEEAQERAPEVLKMLTAKQTAMFIAAHADEVIDPTERLLEALDKVRPLADDKIKEFREELSDEVGGLVAGLDAEKSAKVRDEVVQWLIVIRSLKDDEFKAKHADLEKKAKAIVGDVGPTDVLRHFLEHALAELLSNPRLPAVLDERK